MKFKIWSRSANVYIDIYDLEELYAEGKVFFNGKVDPKEDGFTLELDTDEDLEIIAEEETK